MILIILSKKKKKNIHYILFHKNMLVSFLFPLSNTYAEIKNVPLSQKMLKRKQRYHKYMPIASIALSQKYIQLQ